MRLFKIVIKRMVRKMRLPVHSRAAATDIASGTALTTNRIGLPSIFRCARFPSTAASRTVLAQCRQGRTLHPGNSSGVTKVCSSREQRPTQLVPWLASRNFPPNDFHSCLRLRSTESRPSNSRALAARSLWCRIALKRCMELETRWAGSRHWGGALCRLKVREH